MSQHNGNPTSLRLKTGLAEMLKGGVIMDVTNAEQATIAENAGAVPLRGKGPCDFAFWAPTARNASLRMTDVKIGRFVNGQHTWRTFFRGRWR